MIPVLEDKAARVYRVFDTYMEQAGKRATSAARVRLVNEARRAALAYHAGAGDAMSRAEIQDAVWVDYLSRVWREVVTSAGRIMLEALGVTVTSTEFDRAARQYLDRNARTRAAGIAETSRNAVSKSILDGRLAHEMPAEIARRVLANAKTMAVWRSATIGLTESHAAGYFGAWSAAMHGLPAWFKIWTAPRARGVTCDQHKSTHGQRREVREAFEVLNDYEADEPGDRMDYPGDGERGARASNVINCRCAMRFERP